MARLAVLPWASRASGAGACAGEVASVAPHEAFLRAWVPRWWAPRTSRAGAGASEAVPWVSRASGEGAGDLVALLVVLLRASRALRGRFRGSGSPAGGLSTGIQGINAGAEAYVAPQGPLNRPPGHLGQVVVQRPSWWSFLGPPGHQGRVHVQGQQCLLPHKGPPSGHGSVVGTGSGSLGGG